MAEDLKTEVEGLRDDLRDAEDRLGGQLEAATDSIMGVEDAVFFASKKADKRAGDAEWQATGRLVDLAAISKARAGKATDKELRELALAFDQPGSIDGYIDTLKASITACPEALGPRGDPSAVSFGAVREAETTFGSAWVEYGRWATLPDDQFRPTAAMFWPLPVEIPAPRRLLGRIEHLEALKVLDRLPDDDDQELDLLRWWNEERIAVRAKMIANSKAALAPVKAEVERLQGQISAKIETARERWQVQLNRRALVKTVMLFVGIAAAAGLLGLLCMLVDPTSP
jgi:hypothetical protein